MTYNILRDGREREEAIVEVIRAHEPDVVVLQEIHTEAFLQRLATTLNMEAFLVNQRWPFRVGALSRFPIQHTETVPLWLIGGRALRIRVAVTDEINVTIYGVHLIGLYMWFSEAIRAAQLSQLIRFLVDNETALHVVAGDFNTFAPGDRVALSDAPRWVRAQTWWQFGAKARWALKKMADAGYTDCYRALYPAEDGFTLPSHQPLVRLDYIYANPGFRPYLQACDVVTTPEVVQRASDHLPVVATFTF